MPSAEPLPVSDLGGALLGLLARGPGTGYDLTRQMHRPVGYFWSAQHSQIYGELTRLEQDGLIRGRDVEGAGPRQSRRWSITGAGRRALHAFVTTPPPDRPTRSRLAVQAYSLWLADPDAARAMVQQVRRRHVELLADYAHEDAELGSAAVGDPEFGNAAALRMGVLGAEGMVAWCDWVLEALERG